MEAEAEAGSQKPLLNKKYRRRNMDFYIRPIAIGDGKGLNELRRMRGVFENLLAIPSERVQKSEERIANMDNNSHEFVAVIKNDLEEEKIIGCAGLFISPSMRLRHSAGMGIMIHKDYQCQGVGSKLMETLIDLADNWLMLVRIELGVYPDNEKAIHLYEKFGFEVEGTKKKAVIRNGEYIDEVMMARVK